MNREVWSERWFPSNDLDWSRRAKYMLNGRPYLLHDPVEDLFGSYPGYDLSSPGHDGSFHNQPILVTWSHLCPDWRQVHNTYLGILLSINRNMASPERTRGTLVEFGNRNKIIRILGTLRFNLIWTKPRTVKVDFSDLCTAFIKHQVKSALCSRGRTRTSASTECVVLSSFYYDSTRTRDLRVTVLNVITFTPKQSS